MELFDESPWRTSTLLSESILLLEQRHFMSTVSLLVVSSDSNARSQVSIVMHNVAHCVGSYHLDAILNFLYDHISKGADNQARVKWSPNTVVLWDNRVTAHVCQCLPMFLFVASDFCITSPRSSTTRTRRNAATARGSHRRLRGPFLL